MKLSAASVNSTLVVPLPSAVDASASRIGKNKAFPCGIVAVRWAVARKPLDTGVAANDPIRNHTGPAG